MIQIKDRFSNAVLLEEKCDSIKRCLEAAVDARAYLHGADLRGAHVIDAGQDHRGYRFVSIQGSDDKLRIAAGCRQFTLAEARAHWQKRHDEDAGLKAECLAKVDLIEAVAKARGWAVE